MNDDVFMRQAIELAMRGRGHVEPNPMVGCVIVQSGQVVGRGWHERDGGPHAEPMALADAGHAAKGATAYVTLEPCSHDWPGKKTPACTPRLIEAKVSRVVIGCEDPNPHVDGGGVQRLREAGIDVQVGVLEDPCRQLIAPFIGRLQHSRPYVTLKWAESVEGLVAGRQGQRVQISNADSSAAVHWLRGRCDAIAVGTNTIVNDNPTLTARTEEPPRQPTRVIFSNSLKLPADHEIFVSEGPGVLVYTSTPTGEESRQLQERGVDIVHLPAHDNGRGQTRFRMADAYRDLSERGVTHLLIEPGPKLAMDLFASNDWDRTWVIRSPKPLGVDGLAAPTPAGDATGRIDIAGDVLDEYLNPASDLFFAAEPSADLRFVASLL